MATVRPFRGVTYDPARVPDLGDVTCPPYDVISDAERTRLYERHPYNFVRISTGREEADDTPDQNKYTRACGFFRSWLWEGMLHEDPEPALYVYRQAFDDPRGQLRRVWGMLSTIGLDDEILAHEKTMAGPKADRLALMDSIPANLSPIYAMYKEEGGGISADLPSHTGAPPVADFTDGEGTRHTVWPVHDEAVHEKVAGALGQSPLLIADGHHRFETAKAYRDKRRQSDGAGPWDSILTLLVDAGAQPVLILPYHRIVRRADTEDPLKTVSQGFEVEDLGSPTDEVVASFSNELWDRTEMFGMITNERLYRLVARSTDPDEIPAGVLAKRALEPMGIRSAEEGLSFTPHAELVRDEAAAGRAVCGFLIPPVEIERVWNLAAGGGKMPEKSTYFHPKPRDGIVVRALEPCG